jgi:hypothetical protein
MGARIKTPIAIIPARYATIRSPDAMIRSPLRTTCRPAGTMRSPTATIFLCQRQYSVRTQQPLLRQRHHGVSTPRLLVGTQTLFILQQRHLLRTPRDLLFPNDISCARYEIYRSATTFNANAATRSPTATAAARRVLAQVQPLPIFTAPRPGSSVGRAAD